ncbi:serine protease inhibitor swm-1 [Bombina bombina]|uniref:serine protease inhibitor swm-1 n=1 Tax=Bombina bombina TaxID=8345 RepID=UPI00235B1804|nr:serine protease inhibitor swm-1 [Bombina bombina]
MEVFSTRSFLQLIFLGLCLCVTNQNQAEAESVRLCPVNSEYQDCRKICFNNCDNLNSTSEGCIEPCINGCDCNEGFVFESNSLTSCVPINQCKVTCPGNMIFKPCLRTPRKTCETLGIPYTPYEECKPRCDCAKGYVLSSNFANEPLCIKPSECKRKSQ